MAKKMKRIHLITGGERSGKSHYAEMLALQSGDRPLYVATARIWDDEFADRVRRHQDRRDERWDTIEEEKYLSSLPLEGRVVLVDCVTLWATNFFFDLDSDVDKALEAMKKEVDRLFDIEAHFIVVSNEIGSGGVSMDPIQRKFASLQGWINQYIASKADELTLMVCGVPVKVK